jgi:hypothetical protein
MYGHLLSMAKERIPKKVLNMKVRGKYRRRNQRISSQRRKEEHGKILRRDNCGKTEMETLGCQNTYAK